MAHILLLDNLGSFTHNIADQLQTLGHTIHMYRNVTPLSTINEQLAKLHHPILVLSPGPGAPNTAGCMPQLLKNHIGLIPIIGICLGHQAIIEAYGGIVEHAPEVMHGKTSNITHDQQAMFARLPNPMPVARYHSLAASCNTALPEELIINAQIDNIIMAVRHERHRICGLQFHPESILTPHGTMLMQQTLEWALAIPPKKEKTQ